MDINAVRDHNGKLPAYSWPGAYPIIYLTNEDDILCAECATKGVNDPDDYPCPVACGVHWEGDPETCEECGVKIESAYGPIRED